MNEHHLICKHCGLRFSVPLGAGWHCPGNTPHPPGYSVIPDPTKTAPQLEIPAKIAHSDQKIDFDPAAALLDEAKMIVTGARRQSYGTPEDNFGCIADLWTTFVQRRFRRNDKNSLDPVVFKPADVAVMMILMKCARLAETPDHHDSAVDIAGYAACLARCQKQAT